MSDTERVAGELNANIEALTGEIAAGEEEKQTLAAAIDDKTPALDLAKTRLSARVSRPGIERVRDVAERALEAEVMDLSRAIQALRGELDVGLRNKYGGVIPKTQDARTQYVRNILPGGCPRNLCHLGIDGLMLVLDALAALMPHDGWTHYAFCENELMLSLYRVVSEQNGLEDDDDYWSDPYDDDLRGPDMSSGGGPPPGGGSSGVQSCA